MLRIFFLTLLFVFLFSSSSLLALPRYAVYEGVRCSSCHVNMTGAGKRNDTGGAQFMDDLVMTFAKELIPEKVTGRLTKFAAVGADVRVQNATTFSDPATNNFSLPWAAVYAELNGGKHLTGYVDYDVANTTAREIFGLLYQLPHDLYVKAGRFFLPYGLRIDDDSSPIRTNFNMTYASHDIGGEVGISPGPFEFVVALSNGVPGGIGDENLAKAVTSSMSWIGEKGRVGTSFQLNKRDTVRLLSGGVSGGFTIWKLAWLGEVDLQQNHARDGTGNTYVIAGYSELNWRIVDGVYAKGIYDYLDADYRTADNLQHRIGLGVDFYPVKFSQVSLLYRANVGAGAAGDDQIFARFHFYF